MAEDWNAVAGEVVAAIAEVGFAVTIKRRTAGPATPWDATVPTVASLTCMAIDRKPRKDRLDGSSEGRSARGILVAAGTNVPAIGDKIVMRGNEHDVTNVRTVAPGGVDLLYVVDLAT